MNNQFLQHLKSITPQGRAEDTKIFIPADQIKAKEKSRDVEPEELGETTSSKYLSESEQLDELDKKTLASYIRKAAQNMENMAYASGWKNAKNQFTGGKAEYDWQNNLQNTRRRKIKNRKRGIDLATSSLSEATQSKYNKFYGRHVVGGQSKLKVASMKRAAAILRRGGADDETIRKGSDPFNVPMSHYNDVNMARYRFFNKAQRSKEDGKKSPRKASISEGIMKKVGTKIKKVGKTTKSVGRKIMKSLGTPQTSTDVEITGRNF